MKLHFEDDLVTLHLGDCLNVLAEMDADSVDAIITDPPAGIAFMDREWDDFRRARNPADAGRDNVFGRTSARGPEYGRRDRRQFVDWLTERMTEAYRVLKPGGHALVWSIPRTSHWTAWALEDAGFDIRDCVLHLFGSGFPKSRDVSKAIDKAAGVEREVVSEGTPVKRMIPGADQNRTGSWIKDNGREFVPTVTAPATEAAARWEGWGTALKPGQEIWWLVRKPLAGTVAANVLEYGTGALNIAACMVAHASAADLAESEGKNQHTGYANQSARMGANGIYGDAGVQRPDYDGSAGRWPPNIVLTHSAACDIRDEGNGEVWLEGPCAPDCPVAELDRQSGVSVSRIGKPRKSALPGNGYGMTYTGTEYADAGGASRFYPTFRYQAKAPASERPRLEDGTAHETVKPLGLISWMLRLIVPPGGTVLDMFAGSGPVGEACVVAGIPCILIEQDAKSAELIMTRLRKPIQPDLFGGAA